MLQATFIEIERAPEAEKIIGKSVKQWNRIFLQKGNHFIYRVGKSNFYIFDFK